MTNVRIIIRSLSDFGPIRRLRSVGPTSDSENWIMSDRYELWNQITYYNISNTTLSDGRISARETYDNVSKLNNQPFNDSAIKIASPLELYRSTEQ